MMIWINGAFGAGKTQAAYELHRRLPGSYVYDPENAGFFIRANLPPGIAAADFQDYPMWRTFNVEMLDFIAAHDSGVILVPMTVTRRDYYEETIGALSQRHELKHFILWAEQETIRRRLASRLENGSSWAAQQTERCIAALRTEIPGRRIYTDHLSVHQVAERIAELAGVPLSRDRRGPLQRKLDQLLTQLRQIR